ncbi:hypothetical protein [Blastococcus sp. TF02A-26]|uniref:hypothetical protein n=1 Tax=Blastococcus sp. TF02A-26 TaxID=2250577 RepID=UPI0011BEF51D|nr:hypothetical protein [Blastococcus sp. TF02A-26]
MTATAEQQAGLRLWARGLYPYEAGVELLIRHRSLADRMAAGGFLLSNAEDPEVPRGLVWPDVAGFVDSGPGLSGSQRRIVAIIGSLLGVEGYAVDLSDAVAGLDRDNMALVLAALSHANGAHEHRDMTALHQALAEAQRDGATTLAWDPAADEPLPPLYPWPAEAVTAGG